MSVSLVPVLMVDQVWAKVRDGLDNALLITGGDMTAGELWVACRSGQGFLFVAHDGETVQGASVWRFDTWRTGPKFRCLAMYGEGFKDWQDEMRQAVELAAGGASLVAEARRGWGRVFPDAKEWRSLYEVTG